METLHQFPFTVADLKLHLLSFHLSSSHQAQCWWSQSTVAMVTSLTSCGLALTTSWRLFWAWMKWRGRPSTRTWRPSMPGCEGLKFSLVTWPELNSCNTNERFNRKSCFQLKVTCVPSHLILKTTNKQTNKNHHHSLNMAWVFHLLPKSIFFYINLK